MTTTNPEETATHDHVAPPEAWDAIADGYDRYVAPQETDLAKEALQLAGLRAGERFLDVAAGTGGLSLPAARLGAKCSQPTGRLPWLSASMPALARND